MSFVIGLLQLVVCNASQAKRPVVADALSVVVVVVVAVVILPLPLPVLKLNLLLLERKRKGEREMRKEDEMRLDEMIRELEKGDRLRVMR